MMLGASEVTTGMGLTFISGGTATFAGGLLVVHGLDQMLAGARTAFTGQFTNSATVQALQKTGLSPNTSNLISDSISIFGTMTAQSIIKAATWKTSSYMNQMALKEHARSLEINNASNQVQQATQKVGIWPLPEKGGAYINGRWYTEHALERMAPNTPQVMANLEARALQRASGKGLQPGTQEFARWMNRNGPDPRGIPPSVVEAEIVNPTTTNTLVILNLQGDVITVIPGGK